MRKLLKEFKHLKRLLLRKMYYSEQKAGDNTQELLNNTLKNSDASLGQLTLVTETLRLLMPHYQRSHKLYTSSCIAIEKKNRNTKAS